MTPAQIRKLHRGLKAMEKYDRQLGFELAKLLDAALPLLRAKADREAIAEECAASRTSADMRPRDGQSPPPLMCSGIRDDAQAPTGAPEPGRDDPGGKE